MDRNDRSHEKRTDHGNYEYPLERFLSVFEDRPCEPLTSREVADQVGCTRRTAFAKLTHLDDDGKLQTKLIAGIRFWWRGAE